MHYSFIGSTYHVCDSKGFSSINDLRKTHKIADLPVEERPREKMLQLGAEALSDAELVAILLRT